MIGAPLALLGLLAIAVPVVIHLLGRHQSRIQRFPTLRFITASRLIPTRRRRISDWPLLIVRAGIVGAAAVALSQPYWRAGGREGERDASVSRAVIVDTSASMRRVSAGGVSAVDSARKYAASLKGEVRHLIETDDPRAALAGAAAWLATRPGAREIVIVSDFQTDAIDSAAVARIPPDIGVSLVSIPATGPVVASRTGIPLDIVAPAEQMPAVRTAWSAAAQPVPPGCHPERSEGSASGPAESRSFVPLRMRGCRVRLLYGTTALPRAAIDSAWGRLLADLQRSPLLQAAARTATPTQLRESLTVVLRGGNGNPVLVATTDSGRLTLVLRDDPASLTSVALNQALAQTLAPAPHGAELDTGHVASEALAKWTRPAKPNAGTPDSPSDGRWLWAFALLLIGLETWMRSRKRDEAPLASPQPTTVEDRAA